MIGMLLLKLNAIAKAIPWQVWLVAAVLLTGWLWGSHRYDQGYDARSDEYARAAAQAVENARKADVVGLGEAQAGKGAVEAGNAKAREAAKGSADPLKDGLEALK